MVNMEESKRLLNIAVCAALDAALPKFNLYTADTEKHELHKMLEGEAKFEDFRWQEFDNVIVIAESYESDYAIAIQPVVVPEKLETIAKTITEDVVKFNIFYPIWEPGDSSVGIPDGWYLDPLEVDPDETIDTSHDAALEAVTWFVKNEIKWQMDNALEADYWRRDRELMAEFER